MTKTKILVAFSVLALASLACSALLPAAPTPTPVVILEPEFPAQPSDLPVTQDDVPRVSVEETLVAYSAGTAVIVDVRSRSAYAESHIPDALSIPLDAFEIDIDGVGLDKEQWIITYCT
jgi:hypothetical protein